MKHRLRVAPGPSGRYAHLVPGGSRSCRWAVAAGAVASLALAAGPAQAATINVNTTQDEFGTGTGCSLREAIQAANTNGPFGGCPGDGAGADTINLPAAGSPYAIGISNVITPDDANAKGDFDIASDLTIQGGGAGSTVIDGALFDRVFQVLTASTVAINGVTIKDGGAAATGSSPNGGGLQNVGNLTLNNDVVAFNRTNGLPNADSGSGGGIANSGALVLNSTTVDHNSASGSQNSPYAGGSGGGISNTAPGTLTVNASSITNNTAGAGASSGSGSSGVGGGISANGAGSVTISDSTIAANAAGGSFGTNEAGSGGGINDLGGGALTISRSTISGNTAGSAMSSGGGGAGGGMWASAPLVLTDSTVASNAAGHSSSGAGGSAGGLALHESPATPVSLTNDTIASNALGTGFVNGSTDGIQMSAGTVLANTVIASSTVFPGQNCANPGSLADGGHNVSFDGSGCPAGFATGNPNLGPLQDNGGPTQTMAIAGPVAVDQGANCPATDQRGIPRPQGAACDIGAFEVVSPTTLSVSKASSSSSKR